MSLVKNLVLFSGSNVGCCSHCVPWRCSWLWSFIWSSKELIIACTTEWAEYRLHLRGGWPIYWLSHSARCFRMHELLMKACESRCCLGPCLPIRSSFLLSFLHWLFGVWTWVLVWLVPIHVLICLFGLGCITVLEGLRRWSWGSLFMDEDLVRLHPLLSSLLQFSLRHILRILIV